MEYSRCGRSNALFGGTKISFVRQVNDLFMKYNILLALLAVGRTLADGVNPELTVMPGPLICSHFCNGLTSTSSDRSESHLFTGDGFYSHLTKDPIYETI